MANAPLFFIDSLTTNFDQKYAELGAQVRELATNLQTLGNVIRDAENQYRPDSRNNYPWNFESLFLICGDFQETVDDCSRFFNARLVGSDFHSKSTKELVSLHNQHLRFHSHRRTCHCSANYYR